MGQNVCVCVCVCVCMHREFDGNHVGFVSTALLDSYTYSIVYRLSLFIIFQYVLPTVALVYLNARVIVALRRSDNYRMSTVRSHSPPQVNEDVSSTSQSTRSITLVVIVIVTICIVVHFVALTAHVVATVQVIYFITNLHLRFYIHIHYVLKNTHLRFSNIFQCKVYKFT